MGWSGVLRDSPGLPRNNYRFSGRVGCLGDGRGLRRALQCKPRGYDLGVRSRLDNRVLQPDGPRSGDFPQPALDIQEPVRALCRGIANFWRLALGGFIAAVAIWIDKWVVWLGPSGITDETGLIHAPLYDSAMFTAYLVIIPALSLFMTHVETAFFEKYRRYYEAIRTHATLSEIERNARSLEQVTVHGLTQIILIQAAICFIVVLGAPSIVEVTGLNYQQVGILRLGALGALFQFVFLAATSLLLFFERHVHFLYLQALFLILQGVLTAVTVWVGNKYYGLANLVACVFCGLLAMGLLVHTLRNLTYITFIVRNRASSSLQGQTV